MTALGDGTLYVSINYPVTDLLNSYWLKNNKLEARPMKEKGKRFK